MNKKKLTPIQESRKKWEDKMYRINFRITKDKKEKLLDYCEKNNISVNSLLNKLVDYELNKNK